MGMLWPAGAEAAEREHPYLYFSAKDVPALRERVKKPPFDAAWRLLIERADDSLARRRPSARRAMGRSRTSLGLSAATAFAYVVTGDAKYGKRAVEEALALLAAPRWHTGYKWNKGADLKTAELSLACALVYDWCHDLLTPEERERFKEGLLARSTRVYLASVETHHDWWVDNPVTNWCGVCHGGCGLAALVLYDESPEARRAADHAWHHLQKFLRSVNLADGGGLEGVMYYRYGVYFGHYFATAASRFYGDDDGLYADLTQKLAGYWDVYMEGPDGIYANFGDMKEYGKTAGPMTALFESKVPGGDPLLLWAADNGFIGFYWEGASPYYFLWRREAPPAGPKPKLDDAVLFRGSGHAILQSPTLWFAYNGGWTSGRSHNNRDLGSFVLVANGRRFVHDPGYGRTRAADHSTVLVNGGDQLHEVGGTYRHFGSGKGFHYFESDLSTCYGPQLTRFVRHALMVDGSYIVLLDDVAAPEASEFEWRLQTRLDIETDPAARRARITVPQEAPDEEADAAPDAPVAPGSDVTPALEPDAAPDIVLDVAAVAPADAVVSQGRASIGFMSIKPSEKRVRETFVTVLFPSEPDGEPPQVAFSVDGVLTVTAAGRNDRIVFERGDGGWRLVSINGEDASGIPSGSERSLRAFRRPVGAPVAVLE